VAADPELPRTGPAEGPVGMSVKVRWWDER
jgi:hypothetical protein